MNVDNLKHPRKQKEITTEQNKKRKKNKTTHHTMNTEEKDEEIFNLQAIRLKQYLTIHQEAFTLFCQKNQDYGDAFSTFGPLGVMVRIQDKLMRFINLQKNMETNQHAIQQIQVPNESLEDTLIDLHNYAAMALMLLREDK